MFTHKGKWKAILFAAVITAGLAWKLGSEGGFLRSQSTGARPSPAVTSPLFTPAHSSLGEAIRHFFGFRYEPVQPIEYTHKPHIEKLQLQCDYCHQAVARGPRATIPGVRICMSCHEFIATDRPVIQKVAEYYKRGEDIPWQRVYGWNEEAHVRFNHAPHVRAQVQCAICHGDVGQMTVAQRVVDHTMGFCVQCHTARKASNDCLTCHY